MMTKIRHWQLHRTHNDQITSAILKEQSRLEEGINFMQKVANGWSQWYHRTQGRRISQELQLNPYAAKIGFFYFSNKLFDIYHKEIGQGVNFNGVEKNGSIFRGLMKISKSSQLQNRMNTILPHHTISSPQYAAKLYSHIPTKALAPKRDEIVDLLLSTPLTSYITGKCASEDNYNEISQELVDGLDPQHSLNACFVWPFHRVSPNLTQLSKNVSKSIPVTYQVIDESPRILFNDYEPDPFYRLQMKERPDVKPHILADILREIPHYSVGYQLILHHKKIEYDRRLAKQKGTLDEFYRGVEKAFLPKERPKTSIEERLLPH